VELPPDGPAFRAKLLLGGSNVPPRLRHTRVLRHVLEDLRFVVLAAGGTRAVGVSDGVPPARAVALRVCRPGESHIPRSGLVEGGEEFVDQSHVLASRIQHPVQQTGSLRQPSAQCRRARKNIARVLDGAQQGMQLGGRRLGVHQALDGARHVRQGLQQASQEPRAPAHVGRQLLDGG
jgi:hypothetical protein